MEGAEAKAQETSELIPNIHVVRYRVTWSHSQAIWISLGMRYPVVEEWYYKTLGHQTKRPELV